MNESTFKEIIDRLEQGIATKEEKKLMEAWLDNVTMTT